MRHELMLIVIDIGILYLIILNYLVCKEKKEEI